MAKTRRELEIEAYSQRLYALEAQQKAEDVGYALEMLLNNRLQLFYTSSTADNTKHEFLFGITKNAPVDDIPGVLKQVIRGRTGESYFGKPLLKLAMWSVRRITRESSSRPPENLMVRALHSKNCCWRQSSSFLTSGVPNCSLDEEWNCKMSKWAKRGGHCRKVDL